MKMSLIAAMDRNRLIGSNNQLPWHLPADLAHFKQITMGKPIVMGRKTYESIGRPLPGRTNIVLSRSGFKAQGIEVVSSICEAVAMAATAEELVVIGGGSIYEMVIDVVDQMHLTVVEGEFTGDAWFPVFDDEQWVISSEEKHFADEKNQYDYSYLTYDRNELIRKK